MIFYILFLLHISWRFADTAEFQKVLPISKDELKGKNHFEIHRTVLQKLKETLPTKTSLKLFPFSLQKAPNVYGIIFGAKHFLAVSKFLDITWKRNATNGEADFDIDGEISNGQLPLFSEQKLTKITKFQIEFSDLLIHGKLTTNREALFFAYQNGHIPKHASDLVKDLKKVGVIDYLGKSPCITYDQVEKNRRIVNFIIKPLNHGTIKH